MKRNLIAICLAGFALLLASCNATTICVGDMPPKNPAVCVQTLHSHHYLGGLISSKSKDIKGAEYVMGQDSYKVKNYHSFVDCLVSGITFFIYTPTSTKIYLPIKPKNPIERNTE